MVRLQAEVCEEAVEERAGRETEATREMRGEHHELAILWLRLHPASGGVGGHLCHRRWMSSSMIIKPSHEPFCPAISGCGVGVDAVAVGASTRWRRREGSLRDSPAAARAAERRCERAALRWCSIDMQGREAWGRGKL